MTMMYSDTVRFSHKIEGDLVRGYAAPARGSKPAAVALYAEDTLVHVAQAGRYSEQAHAAGQRLGWCGFEIPGAAQAYALASHVTLRCHASRRVLARLRFDELDVSHRSSPKRIGASELLTLVRADTDPSDLAKILPFAEAHYKQHGANEFLDAAYRTLLRRAPDPAAWKDWNGKRGNHEPVRSVLTRLATCAEFTLNPASHIPGPFHPDFLFGLDPLL